MYIIHIASSMHCRSSVFFFFQAEDGIRDLVRSRGLGDVYKRQVQKLLKKFNLAPRTSPLSPVKAFAHITGGGFVDLSLIHI